MNSGSLAQMAHSNFDAPSGLAMPMSGLASRRGGQSIKPLSIDAIKSGSEKDNGIATPRTSRSHLLAGLRTAPKSATAASFSLQSPKTASLMNQQSHHAVTGGMYNGMTEHIYGSPKTSLPRFAQLQAYNAIHNSNNNAGAAAVAAAAAYGQTHYTPDEVLAPPEIQIGRNSAAADADYAELVATNMYLAAQQQRLQQQLMTVQAAQQQFQNLSLGGGNSVSAQQQSVLQQAAYQQVLYQQQQQQVAAQQQIQQQQLLNSGSVYAIVDPSTGQQTLYVGQNNAQMNNAYVDQYNASLQQLQQLQLLQHQLQQHQLQQQQQQNQQHQQQQQQQQQQQLHQHQASQHQQQFRQPSPITAPRIQVAPPSVEGAAYGGLHRNLSPPRRFDSSSASNLDQHTPLPPPSSNAFRRGHKKSMSLFGTAAISASTLDGTHGLQSSNTALELSKPTSFKPTTVPSNATQAGTYGPGQARAGEHPIRQPRGPPSFDELARKPTSKHEDSKNFVSRTLKRTGQILASASSSHRDVAVGTSAAGSSGNISPMSETAEDLAMPLTDDESVSGRSGSGSLNGDDVEYSLPSSRTSTGSWGAIGSERPRSREKGRQSSESLKEAAAAAASASSTASTITEGDIAPGSFAAVFKTAARPAETGPQRRAPMLKLFNAAERRRFNA
ncbi:hypothetical protein SEPCBS57363_003248 [Sporothrix epigloea]|uniref:Uncharacterized protein n=1 Tax=Sporothrix epigloea TaxID=1892477 RepID=A0ABP0DKH8_9PEZI